jgi:putative ABC transport system substrate-binding protein
VSALFRPLSRRQVVRGIAGLGVAAAAWPLVAACHRSAGTAGGKSADRVRRVVFLLVVRSEQLQRIQHGEEGPSVARLRQELAALGWVEGQNLVFERRVSDADPARDSTTVSELVGDGVDVIVTGSGTATLAAARATSTIPIVMWTNRVDPVGEGLVRSLDRPGGNITGLALASPEATTAKLLEVFTDVVPSMRRVGVLWDAGAHGAWSPAGVGARLAEEARLAQIAVPLYEETARSLGIALEPILVADPGASGALEEAFDAAGAAGIDGVVMYQSARFIANLPRISELAGRHRLPLAMPNEFFKDLVLVAYGYGFASHQSGAREVAGYVDRILRGTRPGDLPIRRPDKYHLAINLKIAAALGLSIPSSVLARATEVIQ